MALKLHIRKPDGGFEPIRYYGVPYNDAPLRELISQNVSAINAEKNRATQAEQKLTQDLTAKVDKVVGSRLMTDAEGNQIKANKDAISGLQNGKLNKTEAESLYATKTAVNSELSKKVDKVDGSRLITNAEGNQIQTNKDTILTLQNNKLDKSTASTTYATKTDLNTEITRATQAENKLTQDLTAEVNRAKEAEAGALRPLFEAIDGVKYNAQTKKYEIYKDQGGLDDVTKEQMIAIYNAGHIWNKASFADLEIRIPLRDNAVRITDSVLDFTKLFNRCSNLEVVSLHPYNMYSTYYNYTFFNCKKLQRIVGSAINMQYIDTPSKSTGMFDECNSLILVHIKDLKTNLSFKDSPNLSVDDYLDAVADKELSTLGYLIKYAKNTSAINVTLHPTAYDKVPETLRQKATAKQIAFTKAL